MSKNHVAAYRQGPGNTATLMTQEQAFLHNGRIDDLGHVLVPSPPDQVGFSAVLTKAAWISHVVLYLNNATPDNTYRFISILAVNNLDTKVCRNRSRWCWRQRPALRRREIRQADLHRLDQDPSLASTEATRNA